MDFNGRLTLPTESFLVSGSGKILDIGAGTGRSTLMVLEARPHTSVVALDSFSEQYVEHFGTAGNGGEALMQNMAAAGVESRASVVTADMRQLPFEPGTFDGIVSAYTFEHLGRRGIRKSLDEASRVLKPQGEFLMMVLAKDAWLTLVWGPVALHGRLPAKTDWEGWLRDTGFAVVESGTRPASFYFLARKP